MSEGEKGKKGKRIDLMHFGYKPAGMTPVATHEAAAKPTESNARNNMLKPPPMTPAPEAKLVPPTKSRRKK